MAHRELANAQPDEERRDEAVAGDLAADRDGAARTSGRRGRALDQPEHGGVQFIKMRATSVYAGERPPWRPG